MKKLLGVLVVLCAAGLVACGGDSGAEGTWVVDTDALFTSNRAMIQDMAPPGTDPEVMKQFEDRFRAQIKELKATITLKGDKTYSSSFAMPGAPSENGSGTWSIAGDKVTMQTKMTNGKPAEGERAKTWTLTLKDGTLSGKPDPKMPFELVLKRA